MGQKCEQCCNCSAGKEQKKARKLREMQKLNVKLLEYSVGDEMSLQLTAVFINFGLLNVSNGAAAH